MERDKPCKGCSTRQCNGCNGKRIHTVGDGLYKITINYMECEECGREYFSVNEVDNCPTCGKTIVGF